MTWRPLWFQVSRRWAMRKRPRWQTLAQALGHKWWSRYRVPRKFRR